jgi:hypothetical protein
MLDFDRWGEWLEQRASDLSASGTDAEFRRGPNPTEKVPKPAHAFNLRTLASLSQLIVWATGECDYDIMDVVSGEFVKHRWGLLLDDHTFEEAFDAFVSDARSVGL